MEELNVLIKQREQLQNELITITKSEWRSGKEIIEALKLNNELVNKLFNKPVETTNEEPKLTKEDIELIRIADTALGDYMDVYNSYDKDFLPVWRKFLEKLKLQSIQ